MRDEFRGSFHGIIMYNLMFSRWYQSPPCCKTDNSLFTIAAAAMYFPEHSPKDGKSHGRCACSCQRRTIQRFMFKKKGLSDLKLEFRVAGGSRPGGGRASRRPANSTRRSVDGDSNAARSPRLQASRDTRGSLSLRAIVERKSRIGGVGSDQSSRYAPPTCQRRFLPAECRSAERCAVTQHRFFILLICGRRDALPPPAGTRETYEGVCCKQEIRRDFGGMPRSWGTREIDKIGVSLDSSREGTGASK